jgi:hypothetical protein
VNELLTPAEVLTLSRQELLALTGYARPGDQIAELHRQGFYRARRVRNGAVVLERAHYLAVSSGGSAAANEPSLRP